MRGTHLRVSAFKEQARSEIESVSTANVQDFYQQELPLSGIRKTMCFEGFEGVKCEVVPAQEKLKMAPSQEALLATAKACELFVLELALRAWTSKEATQDSSELTREDIMRALADTEEFDIFCGLPLYFALKKAGKAPQSVWCWRSCISRA